MFPIRDHNPSGRTPFVTYALIAANVIIFMAYWAALPDARSFNYFLQVWGLVPAYVTQGQHLSGLVTSMFLHGGWWHLLGNMLFLYIFGDNLEDEMGHAGFALFYLLSGLGAAALQVAVEPGSRTAMVGASGAIAGVMGGYLLLYPRARVDVLFIFVIFFRIFPIPAWIVLGAWIALQIFGGFSTPADGGGVAYAAHVGGFVAGFGMTVILWLRRGGPAYWARTEGQPQHPVAQYALVKTSIPTVRRLK